MPKIRHIAITTKNPQQVAKFYKEAFGLREAGQIGDGACFLTDGYISLAILNWKTEKDADVGPNGPNFSGIHHFGFLVDDLDEACKQLEAATGRRLEQKEGIDHSMSRNNFEMK